MTLPLCETCGEKQWATCDLCLSSACGICDRCHGCWHILCERCNTEGAPVVAFPGDRDAHPHVPAHD